MSDSATCPVSSCSEKVENRWDLCPYHYVQKHKTEIEQETRLSEKEAEVYLYTEKLGYTLRETADLMDTTFGNIATKRHRIKNKLEEAEKTLDKLG